MRNKLSSSTVEDALMLVAAIATQSSGASVTELASKFRWHKSRVSRLLKALSSARFVEQNVYSRRYTIGPGLISLARSGPSRGSGYNGDVKAISVLTDRYLDGSISVRQFLREGLRLGLPKSVVTTLVSAIASPDSQNDNGTLEHPASSSDQRPSAPRPKKTRSPVRICQAVRSLLYITLYIADAAGFFADEGIDVRVTTANGGAEAWASVLEGHADYGIHDPIFPALSREAGNLDAIVVGTIQNGEAILALARDPNIPETKDPRYFVRSVLAGRTVATQPEPDSQWALLKFLGSVYNVQMGTDYRNFTTPIGEELKPVFSGQADLGMAFPPQADLGLARGLHVVFNFSHFFGPFTLSCLCTTRPFTRRQPEVHQRVLNAFEKASQFAYARPREAVRIAQAIFHDSEPSVIERATLRILRDLLVPQHVYVDAEAWAEGQTVAVLSKGLGTYHSIEELVDNRAALQAYRRFGHLAIGADYLAQIERR